ncbi:MAG: hypothetical protein ACLP50_14635, partial [Solirubrobacteraceae bacterium]
LPSYPNIHGLVYFDAYQDVGDSAYDWPLETSPAGLSAFKAGIANSAFASNVYGGASSVPAFAP